MHDITVDITHCSNGQDVRDRVQTELSDHSGYVRLTLQGDLEHDVPLVTDDFHSLAPNLDGLVVRIGDVTPAYDIDAIAEQIGTVRGRFVDDVRAAIDLDDETRRRILITGLRALDGRSDLDVTS